MQGPLFSTSDHSPSTMAATMKGIVFNGPYDVSLKDLPIPSADAGSVVVRTLAAGLCGSDLHVYRGIEPVSSTGFVMGHEMTGVVHEVGAGVTRFKVGDKVVSPFTISCGTCFYCTRGQSSRCESNRLFGCPLLEGCQAEYVKVPLADGTLELAPADVPDALLPLMADIFPTGYFAAARALRGLSPEVLADTVVAVVGCGPVAQCAIVSALHFGPRAVIAIDSVAERRQQAAALGAQAADIGDAAAAVRAATAGRGADVVLEVVGAADALRLAYDLIRPFGVISSIGVHNSAMPFSATDAYDKNVSAHFGRCPVRSVFADALAVLRAHAAKLDGFVDTVLPLDACVDAYARFDRREVRKIVFKPAP
ncbi:chaperonin 10-like protein [Dipodascopsis tothii]|uniref:chaperonin 10-like protein n=1 Tax=Dipodascopsis tothii TaxID=44089 RepID=UPI0034CFA32F